MSEFVRTIAGDIKPELLGHCQCHEHLFLEKGRSYEVSPVLYMDDLQKSTQELVDYKKAGGGTIVDAQPVFCGRMAECLYLAAKESNVNVIASTGFHKTLFYDDDSYIYSDSEQKISDLYTREILENILASNRAHHIKLDCKAGIIKTAIDKNGIFADVTYQKLFEAAAQTAKKTGAPVMCHIEQQADALHVVKFFEQRGIAPDRLILCHLDRAKYDFGYHKECFQTGAFLEYDTINRPKYHDDTKETELLLKMIAYGFEKQILLGLDTTNARLKNYGADMGLDFILKVFIQFMKKSGISAESIKTMLVSNPMGALKINEI
ncbi:MAG: hypothetical protein RR504_00550 [Christensenellaceae bacterium]